MDIKSLVKDYAEREKKNHRITNIMMVSLLSLVIILTFCFGVKVNIGSAIYDDGRDVYVRQNIFMVASAVVDNAMEKDEAAAYVKETNDMLWDKYKVQGFEVFNEDGKVQDGAFDDLANFGSLAEQLGKNASKVNLIKYKFAFALAVGNPDLLEHKQSLDGSRIYSMLGQMVLISVFQLAFLVFSAVMLVFAILALIKNKKFTKGKFSLIILTILSLATIMLFSSSSYININWAGILSILFIFIGALLYALIQHAIMDKKDFSFTMLIHNAVLLGGGILALALFLSPLFKFTSMGGATDSFGWAYLMDYTLGELSYMNAVMSYTLIEILMFCMLMLPASLLIAFVMLAVNRFLGADYQHNEKRILLIVVLAINTLIFLLLSVYSGGGALDITSQYIKVRINLGVVITQILTLAGLLAFEIVYKVKPIKKEVIFK